MRIGMIIFGIALFAIATAILYVWGLKKNVNQQEDLHRRLMSACGSQVIKYLKKHGTITKAEVAQLIDGMTVGQFWSRHKLKVQSGQKVSDQVIDFLLDQQYIEPTNNDSYCLKK